MEGHHNMISFSNFPGYCAIVLSCNERAYESFRMMFVIIVAGLAACWKTLVAHVRQSEDHKVHMHEIMHACVYVRRHAHTYVCMGSSILPAERRSGVHACMYVRTYVCR
jgi:hypothetical protein